MGVATKLREMVFIFYEYAYNDIGLAFQGVVVCNQYMIFSSK